MVAVDLDLAMVWVEAEMSDSASSFGMILDRQGDQNSNPGAEKAGREGNLGRKSSRTF